MQKAYSRINWENDPSTNTPLGENNLNKMDKAIDTIDDRTLSLYGYESRVAASEKNAKASETNAKTSEINAKQSELLAKLYMENAFSGTPEGYAQLVEDVRLMDIKTTTDTTLANSVAGGLKINSMSGKSVQDGEPTPDAPIAIHNVGDCVEMMQGYYVPTTGAYASSSNFICTRNILPCASGDIVKVALENANNVNIIYFNDTSWLGAMGQVADTTNVEFTIPSGATKFAVNIGNTNGLTPSAVGKITLTINDKHVVQVKTVGKNLMKNTATSVTKNGLTFTINDDGSIKVVGTSTTETYLNVSYGSDIYFTETPLIASLKSSSSAVSMVVGCFKTGGTHTEYITGITTTEKEFSYPSDASSTRTYLKVQSGVTLNETIYPMIRKATIEDDTYAPYTEKVATILLSEPLRQDDVLYKDNGVWYVERNRGNAKIPQLEWYTSGVAVDRYYMPLTALGFTNIDITKAIICTHFARSTSGEQVGVFVTSSGNIGFALGEKGTTTVDDFNALLSSEDVCLEYTFATPTIEELDTDSQIALNSLVTFDDVTYIVVDSRVQPSGIESEYGTSKVGAYTLKSLLNSENNAIKYNELAVALLATESGV